MRQPQPSDGVLLIAHREGDPAAFEALFERYSGLLLRLMRRGLPEADAQDLVQQTFLQLHRARQAYRPDRALRPWLLTIAMNLKRSHLRRARHWRETPLSWDAAAPEVERVDHRAQRERRHRLHAALAQLPHKQREVIELYWFEELPFAEVAEIVGASHGAVKVRAHRGYKKLRTLLDGQWPEPVPSLGDPLPAT